VFKSYRKRPCGICGKWFRPDPRSHGKQRVCSRPACQRERHRRACEAWHRRNPGYDRERRLAERLEGKESKDEPPLPLLDTAPLAQIRWPVVRDAIGPETFVIIERCVEIVVIWVRDAMRVQRTDIRQEIATLLRTHRETPSTGGTPVRRVDDASKRRSESWKSELEDSPPG